MHNNFGTNNSFIKYAIIASILVHGLGFAAYSVISQNSREVTYDSSPLQQSISLNFTKSNNTAKKQPQEKEDVVKEELLEEVSVIPAEPTQEPEPTPEPIEPVIEVKEIPQPAPQPVPTKEPVKKTVEIEKPIKPRDFTPKPVPKKTVLKKTKPNKIVEKKHKPKKAVIPKKIVKKTISKPAEASKENKEKSSQSLSDSNITKNAVFEGSRKIPKYPRRAQMKGLEGTVILVALIDIDGKIKKLQDIKVLKSSGYKELDRAAKKAMWKDRFKPEYQNGRPVKYWGKAPYQFVLR